MVVSRIGRSPVLRGPRLAVGVLIAVAILVVSTEFTGSQAPPWGFIVVLVASGVILGLGRQGLDMLAIRSAVAAVVTVACWVMIDTATRHSTLCAPGELHCASHFVAGLLLGGFLLSIPLGLIAFVTGLVVSRGKGRFATELAWSRLVPSKGWQWALLSLGLIVGMAALLVLLDVPWPA